MWRYVVYVCFCYVLVFVSGGWYLSCSNTRSIFTQHSAFNWNNQLFSWYFCLWFYMLIVLYRNQQICNPCDVKTTLIMKGHNLEKKLGYQHDPSHLRYESHLLPQLHQSLQERQHWIFLVATLYTYTLENLIIVFVVLILIVETHKMFMRFKFLIHRICGSPLESYSLKKEKNNTNQL